MGIIIKSVSDAGFTQRGHNFKMRLLKIEDDGNFSLTTFNNGETPSYAILSHTWEADNEELIFQDVMNGTGKNKAGYRKIQFCGNQAKKDNLHHFWVDSCCIDKRSSAELSEAINSMFRWYKNASKCYVYLSDFSSNKHSLSSPVVWDLAFKQSRWFTRGWTLQELLAPDAVEFFSLEGELIGTKKSLELQLQKVTGIATQALQGSPLSQFSVDERMSWATNRETRIEEDQVYCLLGIFEIHLPLIYGEGKNNALRRLREEIEKSSRYSQPTMPPQTAVNSLSYPDNQAGFSTESNYTASQEQRRTVNNFYNIRPGARTSTSRSMPERIGSQIQPLQDEGHLKSPALSDLGLYTSINTQKQAPILQSTNSSPSTYKKSDGLEYPLDGTEELTPSQSISLKIRQVPYINIPFPRNPNFTGHESTITSLIEEFRKGQRNGFVPVAALYGIPGVGKTQIAIELSYKLAYEFSIYWMRASSAEMLESEYAKLAVFLGLDAERGNATQVVREWLQMDARNDWIMVFDNADDLSVLSDSLPLGNYGNVLITSRDPRIAGSISTIHFEVETLSSEDGAELFQRRARLEDAQNVHQLVELLGKLPLAIEQAAAYVHGSLCPVKDYITLLQSSQSRSSLLGRKPPLSRFKSDSVYDTFAISLKKLNNESMPAMELMKLSCFLDAQDIPFSIFHDALGMYYNRLSHLDLLDNIEKLQSFALISKKRNNESFWIHILVQGIVLEALKSAGDYQKWLHQALQLVYRHFSQLKTREEWNKLQSHVLSVWSTAEEHQLAEEKADTEKFMDMFQDYMVFLKQGSNLDIAEKLGEDLYRRRKEIYPPDDKRVLKTLRILAMIKYDQAKLAEAERMLREFLALSREWDLSNDENTREVATTRRCLAFVYLRHQRTDEAMEEAKAALAIELATHPHDLIEVAMTRQTIGAVYMNVENWIMAEKEIMIAYNICASEFGLKSKSVLMLLHNLGEIHRIVGQTQKAKEELQLALDNVDNAFGPGSSTRAKVFHSLAEVYYDEKDLVKAEQTIQAALRIQEKLFKPLHSEIGKSLFNLGINYWAMGRYDEALKSLQGSRASREMSYGKDDIRVADISHVIARVLFDMGRKLDAQLLWADLQKKWRREEFGPDKEVKMRPNFSVTYSPDENEFKLRGLT